MESGTSQIAGLPGTLGLVQKPHVVPETEHLLEGEAAADWV